MMDLAALRAKPDAGFEVADDFEAANDFCEGRGWTDGLPVVPPTYERVERMLAYCDSPWDEPVTKIAPRYGAATPLRLAANAVMAGCKPEYFPLVVAAIEALSEKQYNLYGTQATTHSCAPFVLVNGPIARELEMNAGHGALGSGTRSNATIGRAIRLCLVNIGGAIPGLGDMGTYGAPTKFSYCAAENEAANPWEPLHIERGLPEGSSAVSVFAAEGPHNLNDHESTTGEGILHTIASTLATPGTNNVHHPTSEAVIMLCPEHAATLAGDGLGKADIRNYLFEHARIPMRRFSEANINRRLKVKYGDRYKNFGPDDLIPIAQDPEKFVVIVIGGAGKHSAYIPSFGNTTSVTRLLRRSDGQPARSIEELRRR